SFELLLLAELGSPVSYFDVESWRVIVETLLGAVHESAAEATDKLTAGGRRVVATGQWIGLVNALDLAMSQAHAHAYPEDERFELIDFKMRIMDTQHGTDAVTRVLVETMDTEGEATWRTVGVGPNVIEASWEALVDAVSFGLLRAGIERR